MSNSISTEAPVEETGMHANKTSGCDPSQLEDQPRAKPVPATCLSGQPPHKPIHRSRSFEHPSHGSFDLEGDNEFPSWDFEYRGRPAGPMSAGLGQPTGRPTPSRRTTGVPTGADDSTKKGGSSSKSTLGSSSSKKGTPAVPTKKT